jgi:CheY-like chemotaxis protein
MTALRAWRRCAQTGSFILFLLLLCGTTLPCAGQTSTNNSANAPAQKYPDFQTVLSRQMHITPNEPSAQPAIAGSHLTIFIGLGVILAAVVSFITLGPKLAAFLNHDKDLAAAAEAAAAEIQAEHESFLNFASRFKGGPERKQEAAAAAAPVVPSAPQRTPLQIFQELAPDRILAIRTLFAEVSRAANETVRQKTLGDLCEQVRQLSTICDAPSLKPIWQLATAVKGLLTQITQKPDYVTPSTLRTTAGAIVLLETLYKNGVEPEILAKPAVRFLSVDDDPITRLAVSTSLKKSFTEPDLAENGEAALMLTAAKAYDVIFLDVEMPGMDGYEVCTKIHALGANLKTPVVFVTSHSDFDSRAKSTEAGGHDLIAKPFLGFEITVKALTLVLKHRLQAPQPSSSQAAAAQNVAIASAPQATPPAAAQAASQTLAAAASMPAAAKPQISTHTDKPAPKVEKPSESREPARSIPGFSQHDFAAAFISNAPAHLESLLPRLDRVMSATTVEVRMENLMSLYQGISTVAEEAKRANLDCASRLSCCLENLFKKYLQDAKYLTVSGLETASAAISLMSDLCERCPELMFPQSELNLLVVDDDPISRRAIAGALQVTFGAPDLAEGGEAAVSAALEKEYDVIFMDVQMPGMDGFAACSKIHQTDLNAGTPIVFVTSHKGLDSKQLADEAGGSGFITKPVVQAEIRLCALTFCLQGMVGHNAARETAQEAVVLP